MLVVGKLSDGGTDGDLTDDSLLPGASFVLYLDDGDGVFEPEGEDAPPIEPTMVVGAFHIFTPPGPGRYWVVETSPPAGFDTSEPMLVDFLLARSTQNCVVAEDGESCVTDDDPDGGYVLAVVADSPTGGAGALTPPPTDVASAGPTIPLTGPMLVLALLSVISTVSVSLAFAARRIRR